MGVEPTKLTAAMSGCARIASTASLSPWTTLNTPSGQPASFSHSAIIIAAEGSFSEGLRMNALPQAMATGNIHIGTMAGKLNGVMPATTPSGWRLEKLSTPVPTASVKSPRSRCGMPQANSRTSMPRVTEPIASDSTLPCSRVMTRASSSLRLSTSSLKAKITRALRSGGVAAQAGAASAAARTAASTSATLAKGTRATTSPADGS